MSSLCSLSLTFLLVSVSAASKAVLLWYSLTSLLAKQL